MYSRKNILYILTPFLIGGHVYLNCLGLNVHYYMNWIFFRIPCFTIGVFIREHRAYFKDIKPKMLITVLAAAYIWAVADMYINDSKELYLSSLTIAAVSMIWAIQNPDFNRGGTSENRKRNISVCIYAPKLNIWGGI